MSQTQAMIRARELRESLLDHGVDAVSIELQQGRPGTPNNGWIDSRFVGTMGHHIVSRRSQGLTPGLKLVKVGRTDLPGPLCNGYGGFDEVARIICLGWANHPGHGGPYEVEAGTVPANNGRPYLFGWEFEGGISEADWPDSMREFMGACHAGTLAWLNATEKSHIEHKTWAPTRKVDRLNYTLARARAEIIPHLEEDQMKEPLHDWAESAFAWAVKSRFYTEETNLDKIQETYDMQRIVVFFHRFWTRVVKPAIATGGGVTTAVVINEIIQRLGG